MLAKELISDWKKINARHRMEIDISRIDVEKFPENLRLPRRLVTRMLNLPDGITKCLESDGRIVGYIAGAPLEHFIKFQMDPENLIPQDDVFYVWSFAVSDGNLKNVREMCLDFLKEVKREGYKKLSMHVRQVDGLSDVLQRRYGAMKLGEVSNWNSTDESFSYMEFNLDV
jgi:hypothetical protein